MSAILADVSQARTPDEVIGAVQRELDSLDVSYYSHRTIVSPHATISHATTPADWIAYYASKSYQEIDPGINAVANAAGPIFMCFDPAHPTYQANGRASDMFGEMRGIDMQGSYFVPFRTKPGLPNASVNFLTDLSGKHFDEWVERCGPVLSLVATIAHQRIFDLIAGDLAPTENPLAPRELECLRWLALGHRTDRIAEKMSISPKTVEYHLQRCRVKLDARTREQAVACAIARGFIDL